MESESNKDLAIALAALRELLVGMLSKLPSTPNDRADYKAPGFDNLIKQAAQIAKAIPIQDRTFRILVDLVADLVTDNVFSKEPKSSKTIEQDKVMTEYKKRIPVLIKLINQMITVLDTMLVTELLFKSDALSPRPDIVLLVMGPAGAGKSHFIQKIMGPSYAKPDKSPFQEAVGIEVHVALLDGRRIALVDTPGFDNDSQKNNSRFCYIANWLSTIHEWELSIHGILYLTPITTENTNSSFSLEVFARLIGQNSFPKVIFITTMWDIPKLGAVGESHEKKCIGNLWKDFMMSGSGVARSFGDRNSALAIIRTAISDSEIIDEATVLQIQKELAGRKGLLDPTTTIAWKHLTYQTDGYIEVQSYKSPSRYWTVALIPITLWLYIYEYIGLSMYFAINFFSVDMWPDRIPTYQKWIRPRLKPGYSRIEWTCSCGEVLTADIKERSKGSLARLATRLEGKIIESAASNTSDTSTSGSHTPSQVLTASSSSLDTSRSSAQVSREDHETTDSPQPASRYYTGAVIRRFRARFQWLELCVRASQFTHALVELDIAGPHTDRTVFQKIRESYESNRRSSKLWLWRTRRSKGGLFVQFRKDKLASSTSKATVSVMKRGCMPSKQEADDYQYSFNPIPMDEPPMPAETFHHYFSKPHEAEDLATWITRFPMLNGSSLSFDNNRLAKGWGIEILEERDWTIFAFANALMIVLSGLVAIFYALGTGDPQTAVAIGAWLSAIQGLVVNPVLYVWTDA